MREPGGRGIGTVEEPKTEEGFLMVFLGPGHLFHSSAIERCSPVVRRGECWQLSRGSGWESIKQS